MTLSAATQDRILERMITASNLSHLLTSNDGIPSPVEAVSLKEGLASLTAKISILKPQLEALEDLLSRHQAALAPIRRVPIEVLTHILSYVIPTRQMTGKKARTAVLNMSLVSRKWLAASYVHWSRFYQIVKGPNGVPCKRIRSWFSNSGNTAKELGLGHIAEGAHCPCYDRAAPCIWSDPEFPELLAQFTVKNLGLTLSSPACFQRLIASVHMHASSNLLAQETIWASLSSLDLTLFSGHWPGQLGSYKDILADIPKGLKSLCLDFGQVLQSTVPPLLNPHPAAFASLTFLTIKCNWDTPLFLSILAHCTDLEDLWLDFYAGNHTWTQDVAHVTLPSVRRLKLVNVNPEDTGRSLRLLSFPSLVHLKVDYPTSSMGTVENLHGIMDALGLLNGQLSSVQSLGLKRVDAVDTKNLWSILSHLPRVKDIAISDVVFDIRQWLALHRRHIQECGSQCLPLLQNFNIHAPADTFDLESFLLYLKERRTPVYDSVSGEIECNKFIEGVPISACVSFRKANPALASTLECCSDLVEELRKDFGVIVDVLVGKH